MSLTLRSRLMKINAILFALFGLLWGLAPYPEINLPARFIIDLLDWPVDQLAKPLDQNTMWFSAVIAGLIMTISIFLGAIVAPAIAQQNQAIIRTTLIAVMSWYIIDSIGSLFAGVGSNVFFNTLFLMMILIPLCKPCKPIP